MTRFEELKLKAEQKLSEEAYLDLVRGKVDNRKTHHSHVHMLPLGYVDSLDYWKPYHS